LHRTEECVSADNTREVGSRRHSRDASARNHVKQWNTRALTAARLPSTRGFLEASRSRTAASKKQRTVFSDGAAVHHGRLAKRAHGHERSRWRRQGSARTTVEQVQQQDNATHTLPKHASVPLTRRKQWFLSQEQA